MTTTAKTINIKTIRIDGGTQSRAEINGDVVSDYAAALKDGAVFPPVVVFFDGTDNWLADGFHRYLAHNSAEKTSIAVDVRTGTQRDAQLFSFGANPDHGLRRTNADKRKAVQSMLDDAEWAQLSDRKIAKQCAVSNTYVCQLRSSKLAEPPVVQHPPKEPKAPKAPPAGGGTAAEPGVNVDTPADANEPASEAEQAAQDAHGDTDTIQMLEEAQKENAALQSQLAAANADDPKAEAMKWKRIADIARTRQNELMATVNDRENTIKQLQKSLRRIAKAMNEDDPTKLAPAVEAMCRAQAAA